MCSAVVSVTSSTGTFCFVSNREIQFNKKCKGKKSWSGGIAGRLQLPTATANDEKVMKCSNVLMKIAVLLHRFVYIENYVNWKWYPDKWNSEWGGREKKADCKLSLQTINSDVIIFWRLQERDSKTETWKHISNPINIYSLRQTWSLDMSAADCVLDYSFTDWT